MNQTWSIIIFSYNEAQNLAKVIAQCQEVLDRISPFSNEIIVVDDGSTDNTSTILSGTKCNNLQIIRHPRNMGIGHSLRSGYEAATQENIIAIPGDGQFDPYEIIPYANFSDRTIISFYRENLINYSIYRKILFNSNHWLNRNILHYNLIDVNWVKAYKRSDLRSLSWEIKSSLIESEICAKLIHAGVSVKEVPSKHLRRQYGNSKGGSWQTVSKAVKETLKLIGSYQKFAREY